jgi:hypothetical protein
MSTSDKEKLLDSLAVYDGVELQEHPSQAPVTKYLLTVTKRANLDPYSLVQLYHEKEIFKTIGINFATLICR